VAGAAKAACAGIAGVASVAGVAEIDGVAVRRNRRGRAEAEVEFMSNPCRMFDSKLK